MDHINKLIELITKLEELNWQYSITHDDRFELYLGNQLKDISKFDIEAITSLIDEIENW